MDLSIVIVNWNTRALLAQCLDSLSAHPPPCSFDVWVVDNASADGSVEMLRSRYPQVHVLVNAQNLGFARANNQAIRASTGRYVLLLNSDARLREHTLERMLAFLDAHPEAGVVGAQLLNPDGTFQASYADFPTFSSEWLNFAGLARRAYGAYFPSHPPEHSRETRAVDWVGGACLAVRRDVIAQVGDLDEDYFLYAEEMDWCYRIGRAGWKVYYLPAAKAIHLAGQSSRRDDVRAYWLLASRFTFIRKHHPPVMVLALRLTLAMLALGKMLIWMGMALVDRAQRARLPGKLRAMWLVVGRS